MAFALPAPFRRFVEPAMVAAALAALYLLLQPESADHAAQQFRTVLFQIEGLGIWDNLWFGGHHIPGYSVLFPPLGALLGTRLVGALAAIATALFFAGIASRRWGDQARAGSIWFAVGTSISLFTGRLTFALGVAVAFAAVFAMQRGHRRIALCLAVLSPLASPVAALFLALGGVAFWVGERRREGLELALGAFGAAVLLAVAFPEGGSEPFVQASFSPALLVAIACLLVLPRDERLLRAGVAVYGIALAASFLIPNPMGGNVTRLGALLLGPLLACVLWQRKRALLVLLFPFLLFWQWYPVLGDLESVSAQPSAQWSYYAPVRNFLRSQMTGHPSRVEIVPTANHWEAAFVPGAKTPIARGWERQLDRKLNPLFYDGTLSESRYRAWLDRLAVRYVALSDGPLDYAGQSEAALIRSGLPYLKPAFRSADWTVYEVSRPTPLAQPPARLVELKADGFSLYAPRPGSYLVRIHYSRYFSLSNGLGCVQGSPSGLTIVQMAHAGVADIGTNFSPLRIIDGGASCRSTP